MKLFELPGVKRENVKIMLRTSVVSRIREVEVVARREKPHGLPENALDGAYLLESRYGVMRRTFAVRHDQKVRNFSFFCAFMIAFFVRLYLLLNLRLLYCFFFSFSFFFFYFIPLV